MLGVLALAGCANMKKTPTSNLPVPDAYANLVDARGGRYILTLYEKRVDVSDLPFFVALIAIQLRQMAKTERPATTVFWFSLQMRPISSCKVARVRASRA